MEGKKNLFEAVVKNQYGFYELKKEYRREMQSFYEDTYYQTDKALYKKVGYSENEKQYKTNLFREKEFIYTSVGGGRAKTLCLMSAVVRDTRCSSFMRTAGRYGA